MSAAAAAVEPGVRLKVEVDERVVYRVSEVARLLDCAVELVYKHIREGSLLAVDTRPKGSTKANYRVTRASLDLFLSSTLISTTEAKAARAARNKVAR